MSHPLFTILTAVLLSAAMAMVEDRTPRERIAVGLRFFAWCAVAVAGGGWFMRLIHG
jgi:hypothetical protein